jgi:hypothetical protein
MKNTIEEVLAQYADMQINLGSESARKFLANKIAEALAEKKVSSTLVLPTN